MYGCTIPYRMNILHKYMVIHTIYPNIFAAIMKVKSVCVDAMGKLFTLNDNVNGNVERVQ